MLTDKERRGFCDLLHHAFVELRCMGDREHALQASKLAYALHNVPQLLFAEDFSWEKVEGPLRYYQSCFYQNDSTRGYDYLRMLAQIREGKPVSA